MIPGTTYSALAVLAVAGSAILLEILFAARLRARGGGTTRKQQQGGHLDG
ncbi:MAG TPA: hypothetical protein VGI20_02165 [Rhizomicrobium sp.]